MPDVKMFLPGSLVHSDILIEQVPKIVADQMSCTVEGEYYQLDPREEIDLLIFRDNETELDGAFDITMFSWTNVIMEVAAYDFPDRTRNIGERITRIAEGVKELIANEYNPQFSVSITFIPVHQGYWTQV